MAPATHNMSRSRPAAGGVGDGTAPVPRPAAAARLTVAGGAAPHPFDKGAPSAGVATGLETVLPVATAQTPPEPYIGAPGSGPSAGGHRSRLPELVVTVLQDDRMTCSEIRRQLAQVDVAADEPRLVLCLRSMTLAGLLDERFILDRPTWRVSP